jgi:hypothetical protein
MSEMASPIPIYKEAHMKIRKLKPNEPIRHGDLAVFKNGMTEGVHGWENEGYKNASDLIERAYSSRGKIDHVLCIVFDGDYMEEIPSGDVGEEKIILLGTEIGRRTKALRWLYDKAILMGETDEERKEIEENKKEIESILGKEKQDGQPKVIGTESGRISGATINIANSPTTTATTSQENGTS